MRHFGCARMDEPFRCCRSCIIAPQSDNHNKLFMLSKRCGIIALCALPGGFEKEFSTLGDPPEHLNRVVNREVFSGILLRAMQSAGHPHSSSGRTRVWVHEGKHVVRNNKMRRPILLAISTLYMRARV